MKHFQYYLSTLFARLVPFQTLWQMSVKQISPILGGSCVRRRPSRVICINLDLPSTPHKWKLASWLSLQQLPRLCQVSWKDQMQNIGVSSLHSHHGKCEETWFSWFWPMIPMKSQPRTLLASLFLNKTVVASVPQTVWSCLSKMSF